MTFKHIWLQLIVRKQIMVQSSANVLMQNVSVTVLTFPVFNTLWFSINYAISFLMNPLISYASIWTITQCAIAGLLFFDKPIFSFSLHTHTHTYSHMHCTENIYLKNMHSGQNTVPQNLAVFTILMIDLYLYYWLWCFIYFQVML